MKLIAEVKLTYKTVREDMRRDPQEIGKALLDLLVETSAVVGAARGAKTARATYAIVERDAQRPEICPIDTVIEARAAFFDEDGIVERAA